MTQPYTYTLATDGACNTNHTKASVRVAGWGFLAVRSDGRKVEHWKPSFKGCHSLNLALSSRS